MAIFSSVRSSNSHPDLLLTHQQQHPTFSDHTGPGFSDLMAQLTIPDKLRDLDLDMMASDWQSKSNLDSIRHFCYVLMDKQWDRQIEYLVHNIFDGEEHLCIAKRKCKTERKLVEVTVAARQTGKNGSHPYSHHTPIHTQTILTSILAPCFWRARRWLRVLL